MVRLGEYSLNLVGAGGQLLPEVQHNGRAYAVASPGDPFTVRLAQHPGYSKLDGSHRMVSGGCAVAAPRPPTIHLWPPFSSVVALL